MTSLPQHLIAFLPVAREIVADAHAALGPDLGGSIYDLLCDQLADRGFEGFTQADIKALRDAVTHEGNTEEQLRNRQEAHEEAKAAGDFDVDEEVQS